MSNFEADSGIGPRDHVPLWQRVIEEWRALSDEEKHARRWASIPRSVARSMAIAGEPVDLEWLTALHAQSPIPPLPDRGASITKTA